MEWIRRNKWLFWIVGGASVLVIAYTWMTGEFIWGDATGSSQLAWATLPWVALLASGFPLVYEKWFGGPSPGPLFVFRKVMFWIFICFVLTIFCALYGIFIFRLW